MPAAAENREVTCALTDSLRAQPMSANGRAKRACAEPRGTDANDPQETLRSRQSACIAPWLGVKLTPLQVQTRCGNLLPDVVSLQP